VKSKNEVCQCRSKSTIITAAPSTGVTTASILNVKSKAIVTNGIKIRRFRKPGEIKVRRVINKFVKEIVVLMPANITLNKSTSCAPRPLNLNCEDSGVMNVHPAVVSVRFEHLVTNVFWRRDDTTLSAACQKLFESSTQKSHIT